MAYDLQARFRRLRTATSNSTAFTGPSYALSSGDNRCDELDDWECALQDNVPYDYLSSDTPAVVAAAAPAHRIEKDYVATPPIDVPLHPADLVEHRTSDGDLLPTSRYHEPSLLDDYLQRRRPSITFNPEVVLSSGHRTTLQEPVPKLQIRTRAGGHSLLQELAKRPLRQPLERAHSEAGLADYDLATGELLKKTSANDRQPGRGNKSILHQARYPLLQETVDDLAVNSPLPEYEQSASLTSQTTASPVLEEVFTPPNGKMDCLVSPLTIYSPWHQPTSYEESRAWPQPRRYVSGSRAKSYNCDRANSFRRRQSSRRSTNSSISPATAFLSAWNREEATSEPDDEGQEVGDYVLGKAIGFGGFSIVREAYTLSGTERIKRAVKIVRRQIPNRAEMDNDRLQAEFEHEVSLWRCLSHKRILPLIAVYITDFATFAFTQLNSGGTLFDHVRANRQGLRPDIAKRYAYQLASAIRYLHEDVRVVHRDLKLENCLVDLSGPDAAIKGGNILLCDFGLADFFSRDERADLPPPPTNAIGPSETSTFINGSLEYASPESILSSNGLVSTAVDMWAYGVVCYSLIVGDLPFQHTFQPKVQMKILAGDWDEARLQKGKGWAEGVGDMVKGCLCMNSEERWSVGRCLEGRWLGSYEESEERIGWGGN